MNMDSPPDGGECLLVVVVRRDFLWKFFHFVLVFSLMISGGEFSLGVLWGKLLFFDKKELELFWPLLLLCTLFY